MKDSKLVYSSTEGDLRKKKSAGQLAKEKDKTVDEQALNLKLRRLTSGKGRTVIEISDLPANKKWCKKLASTLKKSLGVGGAYKSDFIEVHGEKLDQVKEQLTKLGIKFTQTGG